MKLLISGVIGGLLGVLLTLTIVRMGILDRAPEGSTVAEYGQAMHYWMFGVMALYFAVLFPFQYWLRKNRSTAGIVPNPLAEQGGLRG